jgi:hypothetical protein
LALVRFKREWKGVEAGADVIALLRAECRLLRR